MTAGREFRDLLDGAKPLVAPHVMNPLTAKLAERAGFKAIYLGGGPLGYINTHLEANLSLEEVVQHCIAIRSACPLPLVLDGTCGWGDPVHLHRTMAMSEASGAAGIEFEDQLLPKRVHHHVGIEHAIPQDLMVAKIREAVAARRDPDFVIIGRTNQIRRGKHDDAIRRAEAYKEAGSDMLFVLAPTAEDLRFVGERLPPPLMLQSLGGGIETLGMTKQELYDLGYRFLVDPSSPLLAMHKALRMAYEAMARGEPDPTVGAGNAAAEQDLIHEVIGIDGLLAVELATVEEGEET
ncbi:MAG: isocitrate lyase/phosphoenolpyruvate mutase family protein [Alphaproteobacteria bacterium]|nr:isocitrate lyase/phosphoenolpyruvate mutase family protein [Alphaproteobacteria bacterium]MCY4499762.1 isocitrate lyase/phosphoenolpyruvate mutase family protein [Rhodospirillaceae bacterium]